MLIGDLMSYFENDIRTTLADWNTMPDIDLYMDQVLTYLDKEFKPFKVKLDEKLLTSSMINNYVKDNVIRKPVKKKYDKEHLSKLIEICALKQILNIPEIKSMFEMSKANNHNDEAQYTMFCESQRVAFEEVSDRVSSVVKDVSKDNKKEVLLKLVMELVNEANSRRIAAVKILNYLNDIT